MRRLLPAAILIALVCVLTMSTTAAIAGISGTFVKADTTNTGPSSAISLIDYANGYDAQWSPLPYENATALTSYAKFDTVNNIGEDSPQLTTTVSGLDSTKTYEIYVQFFAVLGGNWGIYANLAGQDLKLLTINNSVKTGLVFRYTDPICEYKLGTVSGVNSFAVNVDDYSDSTNYAISAYYGVSYKELPQRTPGFSGTFIKANTANTGPSSAIATKTYEDGYDNLWSPWVRGVCPDVLTSYAKFNPEGNEGENCPELTTTYNGLDASKTYEIYVQFMAVVGGNWGIYANLPGQPKRLLTVNNSDASGITFNGSDPICEHKLGVVSGVNSFSVNVDDYNDSTSYALSVYYGVSFKEVPAGTTYGGIKGTFVKADVTNTTPASSIVEKTYADGYDAMWTPTSWGEDTALTSYTMFDTVNRIGEDCPALTTTVTGLDASRTYDIYAVFFAGLNNSWSIYAALDGQPLQYLYSKNSIDTLLTYDGINPIWQYKVGTVSGVNSFAVKVDDYHNSPDYAISAYYGVSYDDITPDQPVVPTKTVGVNNRGFGNSVVLTASGEYQFKVWGRVGILSDNSFTLDDGSGTPVTIICPGYSGIADGDFAVALGMVSSEAGSNILNANAADVTFISH